MQTQEPTMNLTVRANLLNLNREQMPKTAAYVFTAGGHFLSRQSLDPSGSASLTVPSRSTASAVRVLVGPELDQKEVQLTDLLRRGAEELQVRIDPNTLNPAAELTILPERWRCWLLGLCTVRGTLLKRTESGGVNLDFPVCNATIEIYEVDPIYRLIPRLPDSIIERLRELIVRPTPVPPIPPAELAPPSDRLRLETSFSAAAAAAPTRSIANVADLQFLAQNTSTLQFRQVLQDNVLLIRPFFCRFFPHLVRTQLVGTATTDDCGRFQTFFFRGCNNPDAPDLYFKAKQKVFPFLPPLTIYAPQPIACHTYWNYRCGTEVTLYTTNPLAITCNPCPPVIAPKNWVLVTAIGNLPLSRIYGTSTTLTATAENLGLTDTGAPWGGLLRPRIEFDNSLREELGVQYYQVSWRRGTSGPFQPLVGEVHRHYTHEVGEDLVLEVYSLGPKVVNGVANLFEIPPAVPPIGQWSIPNAVENTTSAKFPTQDLAPAAQHGKYQLKVDLFDQEGQPVDLAELGIRYRVPEVADLSGTIETEDAAELGLVQGNSFVMTLHVDNNRCMAELGTPTLNGVEANDCGVMEYLPDSSGTVALPYTASHPNGFATYSFRLYRGATLLTPPTISGEVGTASPIAASVSTLLGDCPIAGYSENLYVAAKATDGWSRLSGYDASDTNAFVLSPEMPED